MQHRECYVQHIEYHISCNIIFIYTTFTILSLKVNDVFKEVGTYTVRTIVALTSPITRTNTWHVIYIYTGLCYSRLAALVNYANVIRICPAFV